MIALLNAIVGTLLSALVDDGLGARTRLLTHVCQSRQLNARPITTNTFKIDLGSRTLGSADQCDELVGMATQQTAHDDNEIAVPRSPSVR